MAHVLITGGTMSGKTTFARQVCLDHHSKGRGILALDPLYDVNIRALADWTTEDPDEFLRVVFTNQNCTLLIDEGGETLGRHARKMVKLATMSRHLGHIGLFISQRPMLIDKTIRAQCGAVVCFAVCRADAEGLAEDFLEPGLLAAPGLAQGQYLMKERFKPLRGGHVFGGVAPVIGGSYENNAPAISQAMGSQKGVRTKRGPGRKTPRKADRGAGVASSGRP